MEQDIGAGRGRAGRPALILMLTRIPPARLAAAETEKFSYLLKQILDVLMQPCVRVHRQFFHRLDDSLNVTSMISTPMEMVFFSLAERGDSINVNFPKTVTRDGIFDMLRDEYFHHQLLMPFHS